MQAKRGAAGRPDVAPGEGLAQAPGSEDGGASCVPTPTRRAARRGDHNYFSMIRRRRPCDSMRSRVLDVRAWMAAEGRTLPSGSKIRNV